MISGLKNITRIFLFVLLALCFSAVTVTAQTTTAPPRPPAMPVPGRTPPTPRPKVWKTAPVAVNESETPAEKSIAVDSKVNVSLCVTAGNVNINGWDRDEIRAFVENGSNVGFAVRNASRQTGSPNWVMVLGFDPSRNKAVGMDECLSGEQIELDVPRGATVNIKSRESEISIEAVNRVRVENISGDIRLNGIAQGVEAKTYEGDVTVENSGGAVTLTSTTGNILAFEVDSGDIGDIFTARTSSGAVTLQRVGYKQIEAGSNSGSVRFVGAFSGGGQYNFKTTNGTILLDIPADTSSKVTATYGSGAFQTEIPLQDEKRTTGSPVQKLTGLFGAGDSTVNLTTFSGAIRIKKSK